jgi:hypothetical protein
MYNTIEHIYNYVYIIYIYISMYTCTVYVHMYNLLFNPVEAEQPVLPVVRLPEMGAEDVQAVLLRQPAPARPNKEPFKAIVSPGLCAS